MPIARNLKPQFRIKPLCLLLSAFLILCLLLHRHHPTDLPQFPITTSSSTSNDTDLRHLLFSIASSSTSLSKRIPYLRLWYSSNSTRAVIFLDRPAPDPIPSYPSLPPILISSDTSHFPYTFPRGLRSAIRVARIVKEAVDLNRSDVHWYIFGDDDTVFFVDNLVAILSKYDHQQWYYVGSNSESYEQNDLYSFDMAFGGGGFAISQSLAVVLTRVLDSCLMRYSHLYGSDARIHACLAELGVGLTHEPGFHQIDVRGDLFGMLSAHPLSPLVSLHHLDAVDPIFPGMSKIQALEHFFRAVKVDPSRILQQSVCYDHANLLTVSVAWGYAIQVFEGNRFLPDLLSLQRTFRPWRRAKNALTGHYMFNTIEYPTDLCKRPVVFFLENVISDVDMIRTNYTRHNSGNCLRTNPIRKLENIIVFSEKLQFDTGQPSRRQCCDILPSFSRTMTIGIRQCGVDELISMRP